MSKPVDKRDATFSAFLQHRRTIRTSAGQRRFYKSQVHRARRARERLMVDRQVNAFNRSYAPVDLIVTIAA